MDNLKKYMLFNLLNNEFVGKNIAKEMVFITTFGIISGKIMDLSEIESKTIDGYLNPNSYIFNCANEYKKIDNTDTPNIQDFLFLKDVSLRQGAAISTFKTLTLFTNSIIGFSVAE